MTEDFYINLIESGFVSFSKLIFTEYKKLGLNETEVIILLQIIILTENGRNTFPTAQKLSEVMSIDGNKIISHLQNLVLTGIIGVEEGVNSQGLISEKYSLSPFYKKLLSSFSENNNSSNNTEDTNLVISAPSETSVNNVFVIFEQEFARPLTPIECEMISKWLDEDLHPEDIIVSALREAVFVDKLSFRYIDKILLNWQRKGIKTPEESAEFSNGFRFSENKILAKTDYKLYNWVNGE